MPIPPDNRAPGDPGHITDHHDIADELTALVAADAAETARALAAEALLAPLASPALTGTPTAPTQTAGNNSTRLATTAYADAATAAEAAARAAADALLAPLASPAFTGGPTAPTQTAGDSSTKLATTAFVRAAFPNTAYYDITAAQFGADPTGTADSTAAIQACIDTITGAASPSAGTRLAKAALFIPPGTYKTTADLIIRSVQGFKVLGAGPGMARIAPHGTGFTTAVILIDGSLDGVFEGFSIQGDGTEQVTDAIRLDWTTAAQRSTTGNCFRDIRILATKFVVGLSLESNGSRQCDGTTLENVVIVGGQTPGSWSTSGNWQKGIALGDGIFSNIYDQRAFGVDVALCYYGWYCNASGFSLIGSQPAGNAVDFFVIPGAQTTIANIQSQNSGQFLVQTSTFNPNPISVSDVYMVTAFAPSSKFIIDIYGGSFHIKNFDADVTVSGAYVDSFINIRGASSTRPGIVTLENVTLHSAFASAIIPASGQSSVVVINYSQYDPATGTFTVTPFKYWTGTAWITPGNTTAPDIQYYTTVGTATWTKPAGAVTTEVFVMSGGAGGGSGRRGAAATVRCGGGGGAGATLVSRKFASADLTSTVTVTVGDGGAGGAAVTADDTSGNAGSLGASSSFGLYLAGPLVTGGLGGTASAGTGGTGSLGAAGTSGGGANASATGGAGVGVTPGMLGATGAPSGGGITSGNVAGAGGVGNYSYLGGTAGSTFGAAGVVDSTSPTSGTSSGVKGTPGGSPGSGAASITTVAQSGAAAYANSGAGGSGGGASLNGNNSGAGGKGGSGFVLVVSFFQ